MIFRIALISVILAVVQSRGAPRQSLECYQCTTAMNPKGECIQETKTCAGRTPVCFFRPLKSPNGHMIFLKGCLQRGGCAARQNQNDASCSETNFDGITKGKPCFYCSEGALSNDQAPEVLPVECYDCDWTTDPSECQNTVTCGRTGEICGFRVRKFGTIVKYWKGCLWRTLCNTMNNNNVDSCPADTTEDFRGFTPTGAGACSYCTEGSESNDQVFEPPTAQEAVVVPAPVQTTAAPVQTTAAPVQTTEAPPPPVLPPQADEPEDVAPISCYSCSKTTNLDDCAGTEECSDGDVCYFKAKMRSSGDVYYSKGCMSAETCSEKSADTGSCDGALSEECHTCSAESLSNDQAPGYASGKVTCYTCEDASDLVADCTTQTEECSSGNMCYYRMKKKSNGAVLYNKGCMSPERCEEKTECQNLDPETMAAKDDCTVCTAASLSNNQPSAPEPAGTDSCYSCTDSQECTSSTEDCSGDDAVCYLKIKKKSNGSLLFDKGCMTSNSCEEKVASNPSSCAGMNPDNMANKDECYSCSAGTNSN